MTTHAPIAYTYEADYHCEDCAATRFGRDDNGDIIGEDAEGNEVGALFSWDEWWNADSIGPETLNCGDCGEELASVDGVMPEAWLDAMVDAYVECALWSSHHWDYDYPDGTRPDNPPPMDDFFGADDIDRGHWAEIVAECRDFAEAEWADLWEMDPGQAGHDFWLTRNHHGAGYWDRGLGELGDRLTSAAHVYGEADPYVGDDGMVYGLT